MNNNSAELEAAADKHAFPWECTVCEKTFHYKNRRKTTLGDICYDCFQKVKERTYEEVTSRQ